MDATRVNDSKATLMHWLCLLTWVILLAGILSLLLVGPEKHDAFNSLLTGILFSVGGLMIVGIFCICCYMGIDCFLVLCFGPNVEGDEERRKHRLRQENIKRRLLGLREIDDTEGTDYDQCSYKELSEPFESLSLDSKVYRKFSDNSENGPFVVEANTDGSLEVVSSKLSHVDSLLYERENLIPKEKRQKRSLNWYEEENSAKKLVEPLSSENNHSHTEIAKRMKTAKMLSYTHKLPLSERRFSVSFSNIPEPFEYKTPEKRRSLQSNSYQRF